MLKYLHALALKTFNMVSECRNFQVKAHKLFKKKLRFFHPFSGSATKTSYLFKLFSVLKLNETDIYTVPKDHSGIKDRVSTKEIEFVMYMSNTFPTHNIIHAFTESGQMKLKHAVPDLVDITTGTAYFFNGCYIHPHKDCKNEKLMKRLRETSKRDIDEEERQFYEKINRMKENSDKISKCEVVHECDWDERKETDLDLQLYLLHVFNRRPKERLVPRDACEFKN